MDDILFDPDFVFVLANQSNIDLKMILCGHMSLIMAEDIQIKTVLLKTICQLGASVPSRYLEPPPEFNTIVTHATALREVFKESDRLYLVLSQQKRLIEKHTISVRNLQQNLEKDLEELWNTHKQEKINMKTEPLVDGEGSSQPPAIPRVMIPCSNCILSHATIVFLTCRYFCACTGCDKKLSRCLTRSFRDALSIMPSKLPALVLI